MIDKDGLYDKENKLKTINLKVDGFQFNNITIQEDTKDPLNIKINFDQSELQAYAKHMQKGIVETYKIVKDASVSTNTASFINLNDKQDYYQYNDHVPSKILNMKHLTWYYHLQVNNTTSIPLEFDWTNVKLKDWCWKNVSGMDFEYINNGKKNKTTIEITNDGLQLTDKTEKFKDYKYLDFQLQWMNYQNLQWHFQTWWNPNFLLTWQSWWKVNNLSEFNVDYDDKTGYSLDKAKNKVKLEAKYFYDKLPKVWILSGKVAWFSDIALKNLFDKKFKKSKLDNKEVEWVIIDNKYCSIDVKDKTHVTIKPWDIPQEVEKILKDIENLKKATEIIAWYTVRIDGKKIEDTIWGINGLWSYFKIENIDENPTLFCSITQLHDKQDIKDTDIKFNYQNGMTWSNFSLDKNSQTITIGKNTYKVNIKNNTIDLRLT